MKTEISNNEEQENVAEEKQKVRNKNWPVGDYMIALLFIAYAVFMFVGAYNFTSRARMGFITSPKFTPMLLSSMVLILSAALAARTRKQFGKLSISDWFQSVFTDECMQRSFILILMIGIYIFLIGIVPFSLINLVYFLVIYFYLKIGTWKRIVLYSAASAAVVSYIVPYIFNMPTP